MLTCNMYFDSIVRFPLESRRSVHPFHHNDALPYKSQMANNKCQTYNGPIKKSTIYRNSRNLKNDDLQLFDNNRVKNEHFYIY